MAPMSDDALARELQHAYAEHRQAIADSHDAGHRVNRLAYELHNRGSHSYADIAKLLGVSRSRAQKMVADGRP